MTNDLLITMAVVAINYMLTVKQYALLNASLQPIYRHCAQIKEAVQNAPV